MAVQEKVLVIFNGISTCTNLAETVKIMPKSVLIQRTKSYSKFFQASNANNIINTIYGVFNGCTAEINFL